MSRLHSNMVHVLDRLVSILEHGTTFKSKLNDLIDSNDIILTDTLTNKYFIFPDFDRQGWQSGVRCICENFYKAKKTNVSFNVEGDTAQCNVRINAYGHGLLVFVPGNPERPDGKFLPSYVKYRFGSEYAFYYRTLNDIADIEPILVEFFRHIEQTAPP